MRSLIDLAEGLGAGLLFVITLALWLAPSTILNLMRMVSRTWKGQQPKTND